jgi:hypothetical protein
MDIGKSGQKKCGHSVAPVNRLWLLPSGPDQVQQDMVALDRSAKVGGKPETASLKSKNSGENLQKGAK